MWRFPIVFKFQLDTTYYACWVVKGTTRGLDSRSDKKLFSLGFRLTKGELSVMKQSGSFPFKKLFIPLVGLCL